MIATSVLQHASPAAIYDDAHLSENFFITAQLIKKKAVTDLLHASGSNSPGFFFKIVFILANWTEK